jgi:ATP-dependent Zn protease
MVNKYSQKAISAKNDIILKQRNLQGQGEMGNLTQKPRRQNRALTVLLMPVLVFLWLIGWSFHWIGRRNQKGKSQKKTQEKQDDLTLNLIVSEQQYAK